MTTALFDRDGPGGEYEEVHLVQDRASGLRAVLAVHSTRLGPAAGGVRRAAYASDEDALADALRLSEAMTLKCAFAGLPAGGAKAVMLARSGLDVPAAYRALGGFVERLGGRYLAGPDVGTGEAEVAEMRKATRHVNPEGNDAGAATARGVLAAMRGLLTVTAGDAAFEGRSFVVQGLGSVGLAVVRGLVAGGGRVMATDLRTELREEASRLGAQALRPESVFAARCDVFVPCALGGVVTAEIARAAPWGAVCGSANNPLAGAEAGRALHERGIAYVPDFVANAGAVIEGVVTTRRGRGADALAEVAERIDATEARTARVIREAREARERPEVVARRVAEARLSKGP